MEQTPPPILVLFDIDGTLTNTTRMVVKAFREAMVEEFGVPGPLERYSFAGRTDPEIVRGLMEQEGIPRERIEEGLMRSLDRYVALMVERSRTEPPGRLLPGVVELLEKMSADGRFLLGLLTGNMQGGARVKLEALGLWKHFRFGAYGSDDGVRERLGPVALKRAEALTGHVYGGGDTWLVGDTIRDVAAGKAIGARVLAVTTGRCGADELHAAGADAVRETLEDAEAVCAVLANGLRM